MSNNLVPEIKHPLEKGVTVVAKRPLCPCKGASHVVVEGTILKVITNQSGTWYYLSSGTTVRSEWISEVK